MQNATLKVAFCFRLAPCAGQVRTAHREHTKTIQGVGSGGGLNNTGLYMGGSIGRFEALQGGFELEAWKNLENHSVPCRD